MKMGKRVLSIVLIALVVISVFILYSFAKPTSKEGSILTEVERLDSYFQSTPSEYVLNAWASGGLDENNSTSLGNITVKKVTKLSPLSPSREGKKAYYTKDGITCYQDPENITLKGYYPYEKGFKQKGQARIKCSIPQLSPIKSSYNISEVGISINTLYPERYSEVEVFKIENFTDYKKILTSNVKKEDINLSHIHPPRIIEMPTYNATNFTSCNNQTNKCWSEMRYQKNGTANVIYYWVNRPFNNTREALLSNYDLKSKEEQYLRITSPNNLVRDTYDLELCFEEKCILIPAPTFVTSNQTNWSVGTFNFTFVNATNGALQLNDSSSRLNPIGNYTSEIFDATAEATWVNMSWTPEYPYGVELPNEEFVESFLNGVNGTGMVALYHFNNDSSEGENNTLVKDFSGYGSDGIALNGAQPNTSHSKFGNGSFEFDGVDDIVNLSSTVGGGNISFITITAWVYHRDPSANGDDRIISKNDGDGGGAKHVYMISTIGGQSENYRARIWGDDSQTHTLGGTGNVHYFNAWQFVAMTWKHIGAGTGEFILYVDGVVNAQSETSGATRIQDSPTMDAWIGSNPRDGYGPFNGSIDEVSIWNRSLSADEIWKIYIRGRGRMEIVGHRSCDDALCDGESFNTTKLTNFTFSDLDVDNNQYFQYMMGFEGDVICLNPTSTCISNYTEVIQVHNISLGYDLEGADTTPPTFTFIPSDVSIEYLVNWTGVNFTATDTSGIANWTVNDSRFLMNNTGFLTETIFLGVGVYALNISVNDTIGNVNSTLWNFTVTQNTSNCNVNYNETSPLSFPGGFNVSSNCSSGFILRFNGTAIANNSQFFLGAGAYNFTVQRNDTVNYSNIVDETEFVISQGTPTLEKELNGVDGNLSIVYPTDINASAWTDGGSVQIFRNGTNITEDNYVDIDLAVGVYLYEFNVTGNANWSDVTSLFLYAEINQSDDSCHVLWNESSPQDYLTPVEIATNCTTAFTLRLNDSSVANNSEHVLGAGLWNGTVQRTDTQNYSNIVDENLFTIDPITPTASLINNTLRDLVYPQLVNISFTETNTGDSDVGYSLYRDSINVTEENNIEVGLGVGTYNYTVNNTAGQNYTANSSLDTFNVIISQNNSACDVLFNESSPIEFPNVFRVWTNCDTNFNLTRNGTEVANNSEQDLAIGVYNFTVFRDDNVNYTNFLDEEEFVIQADSVFPIFQNFIEDPINDSAYSFTQAYQFNATINNSNSTVWLEFDGTNFSASNGTPTDFFVNLPSLAAGTYSYKWWAYGNGSANNINDSETIGYFVDKAVPQGSLTNNVSFTITYPTVVNITFSESNDGDGDIGYHVFRDNINITPGEEILLGFGTYDYKLNTTVEGTNYTVNATMDEETLTVNKNADSCHVIVNESSPQTFPTTINVISNCTTASTLLLNTSGISNNTNHTLGAGLWNFTIQRTDNINYTNIQDTLLFTIDKNPSACDVLFNESSPIVFPNVFRVWTNCDTDFNLTRNGTEITNNSEQDLAVGLYNFTVFRDDNANYTNFLDEEEFVITAADSEPPTFIFIPADVSIEYLVNWSGVNFTATDTSGIANWTVNDSRFLMNNTGFLTETIFLGVGVYPLNISVNDTLGNTNWTLWNFTVTQNASDCNVNFNETSPINYPEGFNSSSDCTSGFILRLNGTPIANNSEHFLGAGAYNFTVNRNDTVNYSNILDEEEFFISKNAGACDMLFNESSGLLTPNVFTAFTNCNSAFAITRNGTVVANASEQDLVNELYNFTVQRTDTANYSNILDEELFRIHQPINTPTVIFNLTGILDAGDVRSTQFIDDGKQWNLSEVVGTPGFEIRFNFSNFTALDNMTVNAWYEGNPAHDIFAEAWNGTDWIKILQILEDGALTNFTGAFNDSAQFNISNKVEMRIIHETPGVSSHDIFIDYIVLQGFVPPSIPSNVTATPSCRFKNFGYFNLRLPGIREVGCI